MIQVSHPNTKLPMEALDLFVLDKEYEKAYAKSASAYTKLFRDVWQCINFPTSYIREIMRRTSEEEDLRS